MCNLYFVTDRKSTSCKRELRLLAGTLWAERNQAGCPQGLRRALPLEQTFERLDLLVPVRRRGEVLENARAAALVVTRCAFGMSPRARKASSAIL